MAARRIRIAASIIPIAALAGCAGMTVQTLKTTAAENEARGFRFYRSAPFLFVHSDGKGGVAAEVVWLPDTTEKMSARPYAVLATNESTLKFTNGTLTQATVAVDQTAIANAVLKAVAAAPGLIGALATPESPDRAPPPYLYRIWIKGDTVTLLGGAPTDPIKATPIKAD